VRRAGAAARGHACARQPAQVGADWRRIVGTGDFQRLMGADEAWYAAVSEAQKAGYGPQLAALGALAEERAGLTRPEPPPGLYRCRTIKLGGGEPRLPYIAYDWFRCRIALTPGGDLRLDKLTGSQRQSGLLYPDGDRRLVFVGAVAWGSGEAAAPAYGAQPDRDQVGFLERIGEQRWRLALPFPKQESRLDLIELVPAR
jgi:hypothetical protein